MVSMVERCEDCAFVVSTARKRKNFVNSWTCIKENKACCNIKVCEEMKGYDIAEIFDSV